MDHGANAERHRFSWRSLLRMGEGDGGVGARRVPRGSYAVWSHSESTGRRAQKNVAGFQDGVGRAARRWHAMEELDFAGGCGAGDFVFDGARGGVWAGEYCDAEPGDE